MKNDIIDNFDIKTAEMITLTCLPAQWRTALYNNSNFVLKITEQVDSYSSIYLHKWV